MNTYKFKWISSEGRRNNEQLLLCTTEQRIQDAAESILGRGLTNSEMAFVPGLFAEKLESITKGKGSLFTEVLIEIATVSTVLQELRTPEGGVRK